MEDPRLLLFCQIVICSHLLLSFEETGKKNVFLFFASLILHFQGHCERLRLVEIISVDSGLLPRLFQSSRGKASLPPSAKSRANTGRPGERKPALGISRWNWGMEPAALGDGFCAFWLLSSAPYSLKAGKCAFQPGKQVLWRLAAKVGVGEAQASFWLDRWCQLICEFPPSHPLLSHLSHFPHRA